MYVCTGMHMYMYVCMYVSVYSYAYLKKTFKKSLSCLIQVKPPLFITVCHIDSDCGYNFRFC